jgi:Tol biopolymer transport system component
MIGVLAAGVMIAATLTYVLYRAFTRPPQPSTELTQTRLTFNSNENPVGMVAAISTDGKYLAYSDSAGIHVKLISTGSERVIPKPAAVPAGTTWSLDSWFPGGTQLLFDTAGPGAQRSVWTVSVLGEPPRELREGAGGWEVSPDGTRIAFSPPGATDIPREIWVMGSQGDNPKKVLAVGENDFLQSVHWSPDGKRLAYLREQQGYQGSIETCDLAGTNNTAVVSVEGADCFWWLPDGRVFYPVDEYPARKSTLWQIRVDGRSGKPSTKPERVNQWADSFIGNLSASADGKRLTFLKWTYSAQAYLGELSVGGTRMNPPRRLTNDEAFDSPFSWTADSKAVLFGSDRSGTEGIFKQAINQDAAEVVVTLPQGVRLGFGRLSPDGAFVLYMETPRAGSAPSRLMRIPVNGGVPQLVLETKGGQSFDCARAPADLCVLYEASEDRKHILLTAFDTLKGRGRLLRTVENSSDHFVWSGLSPDGSTFALSKTGEAEIHIRLLSFSGGADREITLKGWPYLTALDWSADGKGLYVGSSTPQGPTLLYTDLKGNAKVLWQFKGAGLTWGVPSRDGRYLAIRGSVYNTNVWMLEGF